MKTSMKLAVLAAAALTLLAGGCGAAKNEPKEAPAPKAEAAAPAKAAPAGDKKMLIVYWSLSGGNTKRIADALQQATGADMEALELVTPYSGSYDDITAQGKREVDEGFKPALKPLRYEPEDYDVIAVGTSTWWYTMSPAVLSFLAAHDWTGKTVIPFQTHAGWPGHCLDDMQAACAGADFVHPLQVKFDHQTLVSPQSDIDGWLAGVKTVL